MPTLDAKEKAKSAFIRRYGKPKTDFIVYHTGHNRLIVTAVDSDKTLMVDTSGWRIRVIE